MNLMGNIPQTYFPPRLFVTGTDTDVGKTVLTAALCAGLNAGYWKPVQAGTEPSTDTKRVRQWSGLPEEHFYQEQFCLKLPMSPHAASEREGVQIDLTDFSLPNHRQKHLMVEGAGGILVPINRRHTVLDLMVRLGLPILLVARSGLGTINHTLMSLRILKQAGLEIFGVVLNGPEHRSNEDAVRHFGGEPKLFAFPTLPEISPDSLTQAFLQTFVQSHAP